MNKAEEFAEKFLEDNNINPDNVEWHHVIIMMEEYADEQKEKEAIEFYLHERDMLGVPKLRQKYTLRYKEFKFNQKEQ